MKSAPKEVIILADNRVTRMNTDATAVREEALWRVADALRHGQTSAGEK